MLSFSLRRPKNDVGNALERSNAATKRSREAESVANLFLSFFRFSTEERVGASATKSCFFPFVFRPFFSRPLVLLCLDRRRCWRAYSSSRLAGRAAQPPARVAAAAARPTQARMLCSGGEEEEEQERQRRRSLSLFHRLLAQLPLLLSPPLSTPRPGCSTAVAPRTRQARRRE